METYTNAKKLVEDPGFILNREQYVQSIRTHQLDLPLRRFIRRFNQIPYAFTLQCCWGHFKQQVHTEPVELLKRSNSFKYVLYRIAYIAICVQNGFEGRRFLQQLKETASLSPGYIQFGSAQWFWKRQVNSYILQVMPDRFKCHDKILLGYNEAQRVQECRGEFFTFLNQKIDSELSADYGRI